MSKNMPLMVEELEKVLNSWSGEVSYKRVINYYYFRWFIEFAKNKNKKLAKKYLFKCSISYYFHPKFIISLFRLL